MTDPDYSLPFDPEIVAELTKLSSAAKPDVDALMDLGRRLRDDLAEQRAKAALWDELLAWVDEDEDRYVALYPEGPGKDLYAMLERLEAWYDYRAGRDGS